MLTKIVKFLILICIVLICVKNNGEFVDARYLPTRGNSDNLDRLRDLLRDILESDVPTRSSFETAGPVALFPEGLIDDAFTVPIPKHILQNHHNQRSISKRGILYNSYKKNRNI